MNRWSVQTEGVFVLFIGMAVAGMLLSAGSASIRAQEPAQAGPNTPIKLAVASGTQASYRVREQLAGINFPDDAVGGTDAVTGSLVLAPDGSIDSAQSKFTIDLQTLKSDQDMRDKYVKQRTLDTDKYPQVIFVPRKIEGVTFPLPMKGQSGFQLVGDMTVHGVTKEVTWNGYATFAPDGVAGRAMTSFDFSTFGLSKPQLARILSVDDKIQLELAFRLNRSN